jgi:hypothetical protein
MSRFFFSSAKIRLKSHTLLLLQTFERVLHHFFIEKVSSMVCGISPIGSNHIPRSSPSLTSLRQACEPKGLLTVARFINLLYTILIFFDPLTFIQLFESNRSEKEKCLTSVCPFSKGESDERISLG